MLWRAVARAAGRGTALAACLAAVLAAPRAAEAPPALVAHPGGTFIMGDAEGGPGEVLRDARVSPFAIMVYEVTNAQFADFVQATGHVTDAERQGSGYVWTGRWRRVRGADWRHPRGPATDIEDKADHPVVQVSARDAGAFCDWADLRLPREAEWAYAAGGMAGRRYPWGDARPRQAPRYRANFGTVDCCAPSAADGYRTTAPVGSYPAGVSPLGLHDMAGNVWEWTASPFPGRPGEVVIRGGGWGNDPYCLRVAYRHGNPPDIGLDMVGFRCARDAE